VNKYDDANKMAGHSMHRGNNGGRGGVHDHNKLEINHSKIERWLLLVFYQSFILSVTVEMVLTAELPSFCK